MKNFYSILLAALIMTAFGLPAKADVTVTSAAELTTALAGTEATINIGGNFTVSTAITVSRDVVLRGVNSPVLTSAGANRIFVISSGVVVIENITFTGVVSGDTGGAILITGGTPTFNRCKIIGNMMNGKYGAGISIRPTESGDTKAYFNNCLFANNSNISTSAGYGGALELNGQASDRNAYAYVYNCTFARNKGGRYGGHHISLENGGGKSYVYCYNSVFWGGANEGSPTNNEDLAIRDNNSLGKIYNCWVEGSIVNSTTTAKVNAQSLINDDVKFIKPTTTVVYNAANPSPLEADWSLANGSVLIDPATNTAEATATDFRGLSPIGTRDLGAYEYGYSYVNVIAAAGVTPSISYPCYVANGNHTVAFTSSSPMSATISDGTSTTVVTPTDKGSGSYEIELTGLNGANITVTLAPAVAVTYTGLPDLTWIGQLPQVSQGSAITAKFEITSGYYPRVAVISNGNTVYPSLVPVTGQAGVDTYSFTYSAGTAPIEFRAIDAVNPAAPVTLYVDGTLGDDSNTGYTSAAPLKSFTTAVGITEAVAAGSTIHATGAIDITSGVTISKALTVSGDASLNISVGAANAAITITSVEEVIIEGLTFTGDAFNTSGKAIASGVKSTNYTVRNCKFTGLYTTANGGVVFVNANNDEADSSTTNIINCLFSNNTSNTASGGWGSGAVSANKGATVNIYNSTFYANASNQTTGSAANAGQAIAANWSSATVNLYNSIVVGNGSNKDLGGHNSSGVINLYNTIYGTAGYGVVEDSCTSGVTDITEICVSTADFTPKEGSIAIGGSESHATDADITGKAKVDTRDIGAYESDFPDLPTGISTAIADDNAPVRYYNLQGIEVAAPEKGNIYIVRQGAKAKKVVY
jgi:hypothetical protein